MQQIFIKLYRSHLARHTYSPVFLPTDPVYFQLCMGHLYNFLCVYWRWHSTPLIAPGPLEVHWWRSIYVPHSGLLQVD